MNWKRVWLIIQREYATRVAKKSFILVTILMPLLMIGVGSVPALLIAFNGSGDQKQVIVIDETGKYASALKSTDDYVFSEPKDVNITNPREAYDSAVSSVYAVVLIPRDIDKSCRINVYSPSSVSMEFQSYINHSIQDVVRDARVESFGIESLRDIIKQCEVDIDVHSIVWNKDGGENVSSTEVAMVIGMVLALLIYTFVLMYGSMIMNSVIEEKTNRIVEVIVSSCRPMELLLGKRTSVALVGFTQILVWAIILSIGGVITGAALLPSADALNASAMAGSEVQLDGVQGIVQAILGVNYLQILVFFVLFFIGGYVLYASLFAGLGSAVDEPSDASQFVMPIMILIIVALYAGIGCMENPDGDVAFWCSLIPFTSPIVMMVRLPYDVPVWQLILSIVILYGTAAAALFFSARIYRRGILLYGKKLKFADILRFAKSK